MSRSESEDEKSESRASDIDSEDKKVNYVYNIISVRFSGKISIVLDKF